MLKFLSLISLSLFSISPAYAGIFTGDPERTVIIVETDTSRFDHNKAVQMTFCPVGKKNTFKGSCGYKAYSYPGWSKEVYDVVDVGVYEYDIQWMKPQAKGLYAFSKGTITAQGGWSNKLYGPNEVTQIANLEGGTVAVITLPLTDWKNGYSASLKRAKAAFKKQYGAELTKKMKFVSFKAAPVKCTFKNAFVQFQINHNKCTLK
ncbi:hypothetical protein F9L33_05265 [Amylibacter sp. SFDW26]|uniref:hypothetical protein n=1 Tax=Amylibacter sp. SFDW26 TaxID=2652722 RepID=UPI001262039D|nr:hypothetical protein [Amylibacter sp. SFDW26]KAB7616162.1 hypothetical protein F9L33_05265 [Amylibacter sp. SFDW26]